MTTQAIINLT